MSSPQQFVERFLRDKTAAHATAREKLAQVFAAYFGEPLSRHTKRFIPAETVRETVEDVRMDGTLAQVIVGRKFRLTSLRTRYRLSPAGDDWRIIGIDHACFRCQGTGQSESGRCGHCDGQGWQEPDRSKDS